MDVIDMQPIGLLVSDVDTFNFERRRRMKRFSPLARR
jgi:hypothetical protein